MYSDKFCLDNMINERPNIGTEEAVMNIVPQQTGPSLKQKHILIVPYSDSSDLTTEKAFSPMKTRRKCRKRQRNPHEWKNIRKRLRLSGKHYVSSTGKTIPEKKVKHEDCKCKFKCNEKISKEDKECIMMSF